MSILLDDDKKYQLMELIKSYVIKTGELPDLKILQSIGMKPSDIISVFKMHPRGCKSLSENTLDYLKEILKKIPELEVLNMSGCNLTKNVMKVLNESNIKKIYIDSTYFFNMYDFNLDELLKISNNIIVVDTPWLEFYNGLLQELNGNDDDDYTVKGIKKYIKKALDNGYNAQFGLDGLINTFIRGYKYGSEYLSIIDGRKSINYFKIYVKLFLNKGANLRLGQLVPSLDFYNLRKINNQPDFIENIAGQINMQTLILKTFYKLDKSYINNINQYLPINWNTIEAIHWEFNEIINSQTLEELIYQEYKDNLENDKIYLIKNN